MPYIDFKPNVVYQKSCLFPCLTKPKITNDAYEVRQNMERWITSMRNKITVTKKEVTDFEIDGVKLEAGQMRVWYTLNKDV